MKKVSVIVSILAAVVILSTGLVMAQGKVATPAEAKDRKSVV